MKHLGFWMAASVVFFLVGYLLALLLTKGWLVPVLAQAGFVYAMWHLTMVAAPRLRAPRLAWARQHDTEGYARELKRLRRAPWAMGFGALCHLPPAVVLMQLRPLWG